MSKYGDRFKKSVKKYFADNCVYYAAASSFFLIVCILPFLMVLFKILTFFPVQLDNIMKAISDVAPPQITALAEEVLTEIYNSRYNVITVLAYIFAIYAAGQGFMGMMKAFERIYNIKSNKKWGAKRLKSTAFTFIFMFVIIFFLLIYVYGSSFVEGLQYSSPVLAAILQSIVFRRYIILPIVLTIMFTLIYVYVPDRKSGFWKELPGAFIAAMGGMFFSWIFSLIISNSPTFNDVYGSMANLLFLFFWIFAMFMILYFGAEFNTYIENGWVVLSKWMKVSEYPGIRHLREHHIKLKREKETNKELEEKKKAEEKEEKNKQKEEAKKEKQAEKEQKKENEKSEIEQKRENRKEKEFEKEEAKVGGKT